MKALFECSFIEFIPITKQVREFVRDLSESDWNRFAAQCQLLGEALHTGTPPSGRTTKVKGSKHLWELKITPPGTTGPQLRVLFTTKSKRVLLLRGVDKRTQRLSRHEIALAERDLRADPETKGGEP